MSVATEFAPEVHIPQRARETDRSYRADRAGHADCIDTGRLASVTVLHRPERQSAVAPVRLTRRGVVVLSAAVGVVAAALVGLAALSAPSAPAAPASVPDTVTVHSGDTLWSIAARIAPQRETGAEVADLQQWNHLADVALVPGQVLRTH